MWFTKSQEEVLRELNVNPKTGLTNDEVNKRLEKYGQNKLKGKPKKSIFQLFLGQLQDVLIYVLIGAAVINIVAHGLEGVTDAIIILAVVLINAIVGVVQESKAEKALEALQQMTTPKSAVRRNGEIIEINSEDLVPGDILVIDAGRFIPADIRLIESANLQIEESALTGESVPTEKNADFIAEDEKIPLGDKENMAFMSTMATYGRGEGVVVATAMDTEIGKIAKILDEDENTLTPLQIKLDELGKTLGYMAIGICLFIFVIGLFQGRNWIDMLMTSISLAVAAIPEGLVAIVAIVLSMGVTRMSKKHAIVRKLPAVETLGAVNIICSDKTGTLTQNKMTVVKIYTLDNHRDVPSEGRDFEANKDEKELIRSFVLCSDASIDGEQDVGDPTEVALVVLGDRFNLEKNTLNTEYKRVGENPFDSDRKLMSTLNEEENGYRVHTKGAIDNILTKSDRIFVNGEIIPLTEEMKNKILKAAEEMSDTALRVLGVAFKDTDSIISAEEMEKDLVVVGIVGMIDPPRTEVKASIVEAKKAGITPVMITGDHKNTAVAIAKELGIATDISQSLTGAEIDEIPEDKFAEDINKYRVFARVSPEHKVKIVKAFKDHGNIVSMTGDGVNDAPSLKFADIGVAMGITGTDVSKGASDMILTDDNFTTIVTAIEEGRNIYNNIKKTIMFLLSCNLGEVMCVFAATLFNWPLPLLPIQLLWINLVTDTLPAISLGVDPGDKEVMTRKPRNPKESFFAEGAGMRAVIAGILIGSLTLFSFYIGINEHGFGISELFNNNTPEAETALTYGRTMAFIVLTVSQLFYSLTMRNSKKTIFEVGFFKNKFLILSIITGIVLQVGLTSIPSISNIFKVTQIKLVDWDIVILFALIPFAVNEIIKIISRKRNIIQK
ncbi:cation-translocating P-type ATPase [Pseudoleptotrichia goodfellowii]|uniref:Putative potassium/sodium efflux P-type ATPase, fungal-type n=1 Tax=Pseudoleptotrichia goodfellowii F0264 TaxID=596323 RepID=D0GPA2_9FUSO|nr:cation-translocating P-type ATPase [Pseudoleptotrichia goodfellowii]EEY34076.1 putative potassium/sodium efflux P-type ATPase, fungal-type [Pseudoleptotrichia goodfellowii F0264]